MASCQNFNATTSFATRAASSIIENFWDGGGSMAAWINPNSDGENSNGRVLIKNGGTDANPFGWAIYVRGESLGACQLRLYYEFTTTQGVWTTTSTDITLDVWNHIAVTYNPDSTTNDPVFYVNGTSVSITESSTPVGTRISDAGIALYIGNSSTNARTFDGEIANVMMYTKILSDAEVKEIYHKGPGVVSSLLAYWPLMEDVAAATPDKSGTGLNATTSDLTDSFDGPPIRSV